MMIRSQDCISLIDFSNCSLTIRQTNNEYLIIIFPHFSIRDSIDVGRYSSLKKAKKVLDMIEDKYRNDNAQVTVGKIKEIQVNKVFRMPEDHEIIN